MLGRHKVVTSRGQVMICSHDESCSEMGCTRKNGMYMNQRLACTRIKGWDVQVRVSIILFVFSVFLFLWFCSVRSMYDI